MKKTKVLFLIHTLGGGGAERALVNLVNYMDKEKFDITLETMFGDGVNAKKLSPAVRHISKNAPCPKGISLLLKLFPSRLLYHYFVGEETYDVLIAYMHGAPVKVIAGNPHCKKIAWLHNGNPDTSTMFENWMRKSNSFKAYAQCDRVVGVCQRVADAFMEYTGIKNLSVIYNTLDTESILEQAQQKPDVEFDHSVVNIVSTGRLAKEKGYERLIEVCRTLKDDGFRFKLYLIGSGTLEKSIKKEISEAQLDEDVLLLGFQENPYSYVNACDVFVCSSYTEGLSTATIEALILGNALLSTDVSGAREILGENEFGIVVENSKEGIYNGLKELLSDPDKIAYYKRKARERASFFDSRNTVKAVEELIAEVVNE